MTLYKPKNMVGSTIASGNQFKHGTNTQITLSDASEFNSSGGFIRIDDQTEWALYEYTGISTNTLTGLTLADANAESTASYTFPEGTQVTMEATADLWRDIVSIFRGDMTWALQKFSNIAGIDYFKSDTSGNLSAGIADRICFEEDTGRILYDNGSSFVELGLSEDQISLANLASRAHSDLSDAPASAHHTKTTSSDINLGSLGSYDAGVNSITNLFSILGSAQSSAPSTPSAGDLYIDDGTNTDSGNETLRIYNGASWADLALVSELFGGAHGDLTGVTASQHHTKTQAGDINLGNLNSKTHDELTSVGANDHHNPANQDVDSVDGYDIVKDGTDGSGTINFKTS